MSKDQYTKLFESIVNHEPVVFKEIFETITKDKATEYVPPSRKNFIRKYLISLKMVEKEAMFQIAIQKQMIDKLILVPLLIVKMKKRLVRKKKTFNQ